MTTSEMIGHAIPAGLGGYLNQDARNQQGEAEFYAQQQAEQQAEQLRIQEHQKQNEIISYTCIIVFNKCCLCTSANRLTYSRCRYRVGTAS